MERDTTELEEGKRNEYKQKEGKEETNSDREDGIRENKKQIREIEEEERTTAEIPEIRVHLIPVEEMMKSKYRMKKSKKRQNT